MVNEVAMNFTSLNYLERESTVMNTRSSLEEIAKSYNTRGSDAQKNDPFVRGAYHSSQVRDIKLGLNPGNVVTVCRPMPTDSGAIRYKKVKAVVVRKYDDWFLVQDEDASHIGEFCPSDHVRRWGVRYEDLLSNQIMWNGRTKEDPFI